jgi:hypothetical protein
VSPRGVAPAGGGSGAGGSDSALQGVDRLQEVRAIAASLAAAPPLRPGACCCLRIATCSYLGPWCPLLPPLHLLSLSSSPQSPAFFLLLSSPIQRATLTTRSPSARSSPPRLRRAHLSRLPRSGDHLGA